MTKKIKKQKKKKIPRSTVTIHSGLFAAQQNQQFFLVFFFLIDGLIRKKISSYIKDYPETFLLLNSEVEIV